MKFFIKSIIIVFSFLLAMWLGYEFDKFFYHLFIGPRSTVGPDIRLILKAAIVFWTFALIFWLSIIFAGIIGIFVDAFFARKNKNNGWLRK